MSYKYSNRSDTKVKLIIEPLSEEYILKVNEEIIISVKDNTPINVILDTEFLNKEKIIILNINSHFFYEVQIRKIDNED